MASLNSRPPPEHLARRLAEAAMAAAKAKRELEDLIIDALKAGASTREIAAIVGLSHGTVYSIGKANGWPTPAQKRERAEAKERRERWQAEFEEYLRTYGPRKRS